MLPNTMACTLMAVPLHSLEMSLMARYSTDRALSHDSSTYTGMPAHTSASARQTLQLHAHAHARSCQRGFSPRTPATHAHLGKSKLQLLCRV